MSGANENEVCSSFVSGRKRYMGTSASSTARATWPIVLISLIAIADAKGQDGSPFRTTMFHGLELPYEVVDGQAVYAGDIIPGTAEEAAAHAPRAGSPSASATRFRWARFGKELGATRIPRSAPCRLQPSSRLLVRVRRSVAARDPGRSACAARATIPVRRRSLQPRLRS